MTLCEKCKLNSKEYFYELRFLVCLKRKNNYLKKKNRKTHQPQNSTQNKTEVEPVMELK